MTTNTLESTITSTGINGYSDYVTEWINNQTTTAIPGEASSKYRYIDRWENAYIKPVLPTLYDLDWAGVGYSERSSKRVAIKPDSLDVACGSKDELVSLIFKCGYNDYEVVLTPKMVQKLLELLGDGFCSKQVEDGLDDFFCDDSRKDG